MISHAVMAGLVPAIHVFLRKAASDAILMLRMRITLSMRRHTYRSFGRCIYCLENKETEELTDEHIIPLALNGSLVIEKAACERCRAYSNEAYENPTLQTALLVPRLFLELKRRKKKIEKKFPPIWPGNVAGLTSVDGRDRLVVGRDEYPPIMMMIILDPAERLLSVAQRHNKIRPWFYSFGTTPATANNVTVRQPFDLIKFGLMICKIAYCYAIAERGIDGFDGGEIRELLIGKRQDVLSFFGGSIDDDRLPRNELHGLVLRERCGYSTVLVQLFSTLRAPPYEVAIGPA